MDSRQYRQLSEPERNRWKRNLEWIEQAQPDRYRDFLSTESWLDAIGILETGQQIQGVRILRDETKEDLLLPQTPPLPDLQTQNLRSAMQPPKEILVLSGIGTGHVLVSIDEILKEQPRATAIVFEPNWEHWAVALALHVLDGFWHNERVHCFAGNHALEDAKRFLECEYFFLAPSVRFHYFLGDVSNRAELTSGYIQSAKDIGKALSKRTDWFETSLEAFHRHVAQPLSRLPQRVWSVMKPAAYVHYPIAQALMQGFQSQGFTAHLEPMGDGPGAQYKTIGHLIENPPDLFVFINSGPSETLIDLGLHEGVVERIQKPKLTILYDNTSLYADDKTKRYPSDVFFTLERTYLPWLKKISDHAHFFPAATMLSGPGMRKDEYRHPIVYVGSLPRIQSYLRSLSPTCMDVLRSIEQARTQDHTQSFFKICRAMQPGAKDRDAIRNAAREFCATTAKKLDTEQGQLEYFLYTAATYLKRARIVTALLPLGIHIYGPDSWLDFLPAEYRNRFRGFVRTGDLADVYASSDLCLNIHSHQCPTCLNQRDFDVPMAGGVSLGDWVSDADAGYLEPGNEMLVFHSDEEAVDLASRYLNDRDALESIREQGHERVKREHTYSQRACEIMCVIEIDVRRNCDTI